MSQQEVYKIVKRENNQYVSINMYIDGAKISYRPLKWIYPNPILLELNYGILCFDSLRNVEEFYRVFCKHIKEEVVCFKGYTDTIMSKKGNFRIFYSFTTFEMFLKEIKPLDYCFYNWPKGTIMASRIRLTKKIWER